MIHSSLPPEQRQENPPLIPDCPFSNSPQLLAKSINMRYTERLVGPAARVLNSVTGRRRRFRAISTTICVDRNAGETPVKRSSKRISEKMDNDKNASTHFGGRRPAAAFHSHAPRSTSSRHFSQWTGLGSPQPRRHRCDLLRDLIFSHCFDFRLGHRPASFKSTQNLTTR